MDWQNVAILIAHRQPYVHNKAMTTAKKTTPEQAKRQAISHQRWFEADPVRARRLKAEAQRRWRANNPEQARKATRDAMRALRAAKAAK